MQPTRRYTCPNPACQGPPQEAHSAPDASCERCHQPLALNRQYLLLHQIGEGGMGTTYLAQDLRFTGTSNELCVLKQLKEAEAAPGQTQQNKELLRREASRLLDLRHPGIPAYRDFFVLEIDGKSQFYMVQQFIDGASLQERLEQTGPMSLMELLPIMVDVLLILDYLHHQKDPYTDELAPILHLDIKPANLMLRDKDDVVFLIDFGIATQMAMVDIATAGGKASIHGFTPGFAPFEQTMGYAAPASDLYAWAMTFVVMLTGRNPRELIDPLQQKAKWTDLVTLPPALMSILRQCLSLQVKDRIASASEMLEQLGPIAGTGPIASGKNIPKKKVAQEQPLPSVNINAGVAHSSQAKEQTGAVVAAATEAYAPEAHQTAHYDSTPTPAPKGPETSSSHKGENAKTTDEPSLQEGRAAKAPLSPKKKPQTRSFPLREDNARAAASKRKRPLLLFGLGIIGLMATNLLVVHYLSSKERAKEKAKGNASLSSKTTNATADPTGPKRVPARVIATHQRAHMPKPTPASSKNKPKMRLQARMRALSPTSRPTVGVRQSSAIRGAALPITRRIEPSPPGKEPYPPTTRPTTAPKPKAPPRPVKDRPKVALQMARKPVVKQPQPLPKSQVDDLLHKYRFAYPRETRRLFRNLKILQAKRPDVTRQVYIAFLRRGSYDLRARTVRRCTRFFPTPTAELVRYLKEALDSPHLGRGVSQVHLGALEALKSYAYKKHDKAAVEAMLHTWHHHKRKRVQYTAMALLSFLDKPRHRKRFGPQVYRSYVKLLRQWIDETDPGTLKRVLQQIQHHQPTPKVLVRLGQIYLSNAVGTLPGQAGDVIARYCTNDRRACQLLLKGTKSREPRHLRANLFKIYAKIPALKKHHLAQETYDATLPLLSARNSIEIAIKALHILGRLGAVARKALPKLRHLQQQKDQLFVHARSSRRSYFALTLQRTIAALKPKATKARR